MSSKTIILFAGPMPRAQVGAFPAVCFATLLLLLLSGVPELSASSVIPAPPQVHPILLAGGTVHTVSGAVLESTDVLFVDGRIAQIGRRLARTRDTEVIDVKGRRVYPGLVAAFTRLGLLEIAAVRATRDIAETGMFNPSVRAQVAVNADSELLPVARTNGVLTALTVPAASAKFIAGISAVIRLDGWTWEDLSIRAAAALHVYWPQMRLDRSPQAAKPPADQQKDLEARLREFGEAWAAARAYAQAKSAAATAGRPPPDTDLRWEAMTPVFTGVLPVFIHADELKQIESALAWAARQQVKITLVGGADAWRVAALLRAADVPVILAGANNLPLRRDDDFDAPFTNAEKLRAAGVRFCIAGQADGSGFGNERNLPYESAKAVAYGLPRDEAIKAITLHAAQLLGVGDELGSVEVGKRATLIVTDGDPLEIPTQVALAFIDGRRIDLANRQTMLRDKYSERLRRLGDDG